MWLRLDNSHMDAKRYPAPQSFEWSDTIPEGVSRIIRTPSAVAHPPPLQQISVNFDRALPLPTVFELDAATGWAEFEAAVLRDTER
jgi:hypothetical protein